jgi:hypothetical protein
MSKKAGITLLDLLLSSLMFAMVAAALSRAFYFAVHYELNAPGQRDRYEAQIRFEDRMRNLIQQAYISSSSTDISTYFIGTEGGQNPNGSPNLTAAQAAPGTAAANATVGQTTNANAGGGAAPGGNSDGIVFTMLGNQISPQYLQVTGVPLTDTDQADQGQSGGSQNFQQVNALPNGQDVNQDFGQLNSDYGPQGGATEVSISQTPVGDPGQYANELYIRTQTPADADYTQGGTEQVFDDNIQTIQFEFYDGQQWDGSWDTTQSGQHYLPSAVRIHYWMKSDPNTEHVFVVRIPLSTLTPQTPLSAATAGTTTTTGAGGAGGGARAGGGGGAGAGGPAGGGGGGLGGGGRGAGAFAPFALPEVGPAFSNLTIVPEADNTTPLDAKALFSSNPLDELSSKPPANEIVPQPAVPDWRKPPGPFEYVPAEDPLAPPPTTPATPPIKGRSVKSSQSAPSKPTMPQEQQAEVQPPPNAAKQLGEDKGIAVGQAAQGGA